MSGTVELKIWLKRWFDLAEICTSRSYQFGEDTVVGLHWIWNATKSKKKAAAAAAAASRQVLFGAEFPKGAVILSGH